MLKKEIAVADKGRVMIGSISESYQPLEKKYGLTAQLLEILYDGGVDEIVILTRSDLILRDIGLLKKFKKCKVFFTISGGNELIKLFENNSPIYEKRIEAISELQKNNILVWIHIGPIIPYFTNVKQILADLKHNCGLCKVEFESLNSTTAPIDEIIKKLMGLNHNDAVKLKDLYSNTENYSDYWISEKKKISEYSDMLGFKTFFSFPALNEYF